MKKIILVCLLLFLSTSLLFSQVDFFGYFESEGDYMMFENDEYYFGYNKLRLDLLGIPGDKIEVGANIVYKNFNGKTTWNLMDFIPEKYWPQITSMDDSLYLTNLPIEMSDTLFLDNAFLQLEIKNLRLILGRQQISTGVGYAWNPTDIFNKKDMMDPTYEQTGVDAMTIEFPLWTGSSFTGILQPKENWETTTKFIKYKQNIGLFDFSLSYGDKQWTHYYFNELDFSNVEYYYNQYSYGGTVVGELFGIGVWTEIGIYDNFLKGFNNTSMVFSTPIDSIIQSYKWQNETVVGIDYTFKNSLYLMAEYFHTDFGVKTDDLDFNQYLNYFQSNIHGLNQNYLFTNVMYPLTDSFTIGFFNIANLDDKSIVFNPQFKYLLGNNIELSFISSIFYGDDDTEFGTQDYNFRLRLKAYF